MFEAHLLSKGMCMRGEKQLAKHPFCVQRGPLLNWTGSIFPLLILFLIQKSTPSNFCPIHKACKLKRGSSHAKQTCHSLDLKGQQSEHLWRLALLWLSLGSAQRLTKSPPKAESAVVGERSRIQVCRSIRLQNPIWGSQAQCTTVWRFFLCDFIRHDYDCYGPIDQSNFVHKLFEHPHESGTSRRSSRDIPAKTPFLPRASRDKPAFWPLPSSN